MLLMNPAGMFGDLPAFYRALLNNVPNPRNAPRKGLFLTASFVVAGWSSSAQPRFRRDDLI